MRHKNFIILALAGSTLVAAGMALWPLFVFLPTAALRALILAPLYALFVNIILTRVQFAGALLAFSLVPGVILLIFTPLLLPVSVLAGVAAEAVAWLLGKVLRVSPWQKHKTLRWFGAALFPALQFPLMLSALAVTVGGPSAGLVASPGLVALVTVIGIVPGLFGCWLGEQISSRLRGLKN
ncbi:MAG: MptD family putative ECF transporter S component [Firmicutes bacterium]|nr:MptD family putative ECF transporter S component [Bacillota bacterium]